MKTLHCDHCMHLLCDAFTVLMVITQLCTDLCNSYIATQYMYLLHMEWCGLCSQFIVYMCDPNVIAY